MAGFDPAKIVENLIKGKGVTPTRNLTPRKAPGSKKTPVAGAVSNAQKVVGDVESSAREHIGNLDKTQRDTLNSISDFFNPPKKAKPKPAPKVTKRASATGRLGSKAPGKGSMLGIPGAVEKAKMAAKEKVQRDLTAAEKRKLSESNKAWNKKATDRANRQKKKTARLYKKRTTARKKKQTKKVTRLTRRINRRERGDS